MKQFSFPKLPYLVLLEKINFIVFCADAKRLALIRLLDLLLFVE